MSGGITNSQFAVFSLQWAVVKMKTKIIRSQTKETIKLISDEEREDTGLLIMMMETNRTKLVTREKVMKKLNQIN
ncbi:MAG: hypothetical protein JWR54_1409 [Mucilaginibacter sp.]|nr:hypothetical protein [Mucilaginibacter sp.]